MKKFAPLLAAITVATIIGGTLWYAKTQGIDVLEPQGYISAHQRDLFLFALGLLLIPLFVVYAITYTVTHRYNVDNHKVLKRFNKAWQMRPQGSVFWAVFISLLASVLAVVLITSTINIDPYKPLFKDKPSKTIRVVALPWKWLFIYPDEQIATINELVVPVNQPVTYELTADAPMSSFWIPKLGGMIYTMEGMVTKLNLMATSPGVFEGKNAEINGAGYAGMKFTTRAVTQEEYDAWVRQVRQAPQALDDHLYAQLAKQSTDNPIQHYSHADPALFGRILAKFMHMDMDMEHHTAESETQQAAPVNAVTPMPSTTHSQH